jgi:hypothetical protein
MTAIAMGRLNWTLTRDSDGYREYKLTTLVWSAFADGPTHVMLASGLPRVGSYWVFDNDYDYWAWCRPDMTVTPMITNEPNRFWTVEQTFSSKPRDQNSQDQRDDPTTDGPTFSGSFARWSRETKLDRNDDPILSSSLEQITGVEKDDTRPTVSFEWNTLVLDLYNMTRFINKVNDRPMWGLPKHCIKLNEISWSRHLYAQQGYYFKKKWDFEVRFDSFDNSKILDTGFRCLKGEWVKPAPPATEWTWAQEAGIDKTKATNFIRVKDQLESPEPMRIPLDGNGGRLTDPTTPVFIDKVEIYDEVNFLLYGVPSQLG